MHPDRRARGHAGAASLSRQRRIGHNRAVRAAPAANRLRLPPHRHRQHRLVTGQFVDLDTEIVGVRRCSVDAADSGGNDGC